MLFSKSRNRPARLILIWRDGVLNKLLNRWGVERVTKSCGNVFADLGFDPAEATNLRLRSQLMIALDRFIRANDLTQQAAAQRFGITQSRVSDLMRGKIALFSLDMLVNLAAKAGLDVALSITSLAECDDVAPKQTEETS